MSSYRKSMSEVYNNMYLSEDNVAVLRNIVKNKQMQPVKFSDGKMKVDLFTASAVTQALDKVNDKNREKITKLINTGKKSAFASIAKVVMKSENDLEIEEAVSMAQQAAIAISKKERGNKPKKEEVELDELMPATKHVAKSKKNPDMFCVFDKDGNEVKLFKDKKDAEEYAVKNHDALNEEEVDLDEEWKVGDKASYMGKSVKVTKVYRNGGYQIDGKTNVSGNQLRIEEVDLDEAVKVGDNIKVKLRRKGREYIEKGEVIKIEGDKIIVKHDFSRTPSGVKMTDIVKEEVEIDEASARADAMKAMRKGKSVDPADVDTDATDDDVKAASKNIIMQLRKSVNLRGTFAVEFDDKKKVKVSAKIAQAAQNKYNTMRRPADKEKFQMKISKSYKDLLKAIKEETVKESKFSLINKQLKGEK